MSQGEAVGGTINPAQVVIVASLLQKFPHILPHQQQQNPLFNSGIFNATIQYDQLYHLKGIILMWLNS